MSIKELLTSLKSWMEAVYSSTANMEARPWCDLGHKEALNQEKIREHFDREELNKIYETRVKEEDYTKKQPYAFVQAEINLIYGFHKCFVARHKTRLQHYRDDCAQKHYHTRSAIELSEGKFYAARNKAEKKKDANQ